MTDTNYIIIKDTDDIDELERNWELFNTQMTNRQKRLSDDRSIEIWNMTNQDHYLALKKAIEGDKEPISEEDEDAILPDDIDTSFDFGEEELDNLDMSESEEDDNEKKEEPTLEHMVITNEALMSTTDADSSTESTPDNRDITDPEYKRQTLDDMIKVVYHNTDKDLQVDQWEVDTNINIIGGLHGNHYNAQSMMADLEKQYREWNSQNQDHRKKADDYCRQVYGMSNIERYNKLKSIIQASIDRQAKYNKPKQDTVDASKLVGLGEFVQERIEYRKVLAEANSQTLKRYKHHKFNDTPYFTPTEMIDMGVYTNHNYYSNEPDNDGLIQGTLTATWFDDYKSMCMDHVFEDHTDEWIGTLNSLYEDFETIKESGDVQAILNRKQSILELGWNPEIQFTHENRIKAANRINKYLDSIPSDVYIPLEEISECDDGVLQEVAKSSTHKPVFLVFTEGKTAVISKSIQFFTGSKYTHIGISFDSSIDKDVYSFNKDGLKGGFVKEDRAFFEDNDIAVMAFYVPNKVFTGLKEAVKDFENHKTKFNLHIFFNKMLHIDKFPGDDVYKQVCSTFVDYVLKSQDIDITGKNIPDPGQFYLSTKDMPNKIIEVYTGPVAKYDSKKVDRKLATLLNKSIESIEEAVLLEISLPNGYSLRPANKNDSDSMFKWEMESIDPKLRKQQKIINLMKKDVQDSIPETRIIMYNGEAVGMVTESTIDSVWHYIGEIYLTKEHRGNGVGSTILKNIIAKYDKVILQVDKKNIKAQKLYKSLGFKITKSNDDNSMYIMKLDKTNPVNESVLNEVKRFPVEFDKDGNLIIYKCRSGSISYEDEIKDTVKLLENYRNTNDVEGIKYELSKLWYLIDSIEKELKKKTVSQDRYKMLVDSRSIALNIFKQNFEYITKSDKTFNFSEYYNTTPFSDSSTRISASTIKYAIQTVKAIILTNK